MAAPRKVPRPARVDAHHADALSDRGAPRGRPAAAPRSDVAQAPGRRRAGDRAAARGPRNPLRRRPPRPVRAAERDVRFRPAGGRPVAWRLPRGRQPVAAHEPRLYGLCGADAGARRRRGSFRRLHHAALARGAEPMVGGRRVRRCMDALRGQPPADQPSGRDGALSRPRRPRGARDRDRDPPARPVLRRVRSAKPRARRAVQPPAQELCRARRLLFRAGAATAADGVPAPRRAQQCPPERSARRRPRRAQPDVSHPFDPRPQGAAWNRPFPGRVATAARHHHRPDGDRAQRHEPPRRRHRAVQRLVDRRGAAQLGYRRSRRRAGDPAASRHRICPSRPRRRRGAVRLRALRSGRQPGPCPCGTISRSRSPSTANG